MSLSKHDLALSRSALNNLEALKKENKNLEQDIVTYSSYALLFELLACSVCKTNHGFRLRGEQYRCTSTCSPQCLAALIKEGIISSTSGQPEPQTPVQNGIVNHDEPVKVTEPPLVEDPPLQNGLPDEKFTANGQGITGLPALRMVRPKSSASVEDPEDDAAEVKTGSAVPKSDAPPTYKSPFSITSATILPSKPKSDPTPSSKPEPTVKTVPKPEPRATEPAKKWTLEDLKLSPIFHEPSGEFTIVYSWDATIHLLQSDQLEEELLEVVEKLQNYYYTVHEKPLTTLPEPLQVICALFSVDNGLYRCVVMKVNRERESVSVRFLDFGADEEVPLTKCFPVCQEIMEQHLILGVEFHLSLPEDVVHIPTLEEISAEDLKTSPVLIETEEQLNEIVWKGQLKLKDGKNVITKMPFKFMLKTIPEIQGEEATLQPDSPRGKEEERVRNPFKKEVAKDALQVSSSSEDSGVQDTSLNSSFGGNRGTSKQDVSPLKASPAPPPAPIKTSTPIKQVTSVAQTVASPAPPPTPIKTSTPVKQATSVAPQVASPASTTVSRRKKTFAFHSMNLSPSLADDAKVRVTFNWTAGKVTIVAIADDDVLRDFEDKVYEYAQTAPPLTAVPEINTVVIGPYDDGFYRGRVSSKAGDNVTVEFFDLGDSVTVPYGQCRQISPELFKVPVYGVMLSIDGVPDSLPATAVPETLDGKQWILETTEKTNVFNWTGQLWDEKEVSYALHVLQPRK